MKRKMFSSTTIASSITMPTISVSASIVMLLSVKPRASMQANVATIDAGIAEVAISVVRQSLMKARIVSETSPGSRDDLWIVPAAGGEPRAYVQSPFNELQGAFSPDGQWLAYASDESGRFEIYVDSFPSPGKRARVTSGGGSDPRWDRSGRLYFRRGTEIHTAAIARDGVVPEALSSERLFDAADEIRAYDVAPDGQRFLLNLPQHEAAPRLIAVVVNWRTGTAVR